MVYRIYVAYFLLLYLRLSNSSLTVTRKSTDNFNGIQCSKVKDAESKKGICFCKRGKTLLSDGNGKLRCYAIKQTKDCLYKKILGLNRDGSLRNSFNNPCQVAKVVKLEYWNYNENTEKSFWVKSTALENIVESSIKTTKLNYATNKLDIKGLVMKLTVTCKSSLNLLTKCILVKTNGEREYPIATNHFDPIITTALPTYTTSTSTPPITTKSTPTARSTTTTPTTTSNSNNTKVLERKNENTNNGSSSLIIGIIIPLMLIIIAVIIIFIFIKKRRRKREKKSEVVAQKPVVQSSPIYTTFDSGKKENHYIKDDHGIRDSNEYSSLDKFQMSEYAASSVNEYAPSSMHEYIPNSIKLSPQNISTDTQYKDLHYDGDNIYADLNNETPPVLYKELEPPAYEVAVNNKEGGEWEEDHYHSVDDLDTSYYTTPNEKNDESQNEYLAIP